MRARSGTSLGWFSIVVHPLRAPRDRPRAARDTLPGGAGRRNRTRPMRCAGLTTPGAELIIAAAERTVREPRTRAASAGGTVQSKTRPEGRPQRGPGAGSRRFPAGPVAAGLVALGPLVAALLLATPSPAAPQAPPAPAVPQAPPAQPISVAQPVMPPPLAQGPTPDLDLLFSAQVAGWVEPCG